jgi:Tfp pilus assembly protein PilF
MRTRACVSLFLAWAALALAPARPGAVRGDVIIPGQLPQRDYLRLPEKDAEVDRAIRQFEQGDPAGCLGSLRTAVKANPGLAPARVLLAKLFLLHDQIGPGRAELERAVVEGPRHPETHILFGHLALEDGRLADASLQFEKAAATAADLPDTARRGWQARAHSGSAEVAERRADWVTAAAELEVLLASDPANPHARARLGKAVFRLGRTEEAYDNLRRATEADPSYEPPAVTMAHLFSEADNPAKVTEWFEYAVTHAPKDARVRTAYAAWLLDRDRPDDARRHADEAARLDPKAPEVRLLQGLIAWQARRFPDAERLFLGLHEESPSNFDAINYLALALADQDDPVRRQRALELAEINARLHPGSGTALTTLGRVNDRLGRPAAAEKALRAAIQTGSAIPETPYYLACLLADRGGDLTQVQRLFRLALDAPGHFAFRKDALVRLDRLEGKLPKP